MSTDSSPANARQRSKYWCFTVNNPSSTEVPSSLLPPSAYSLLVYQLESGENGTRHYQGYVELNRPQSLCSVRNLLGGRAHVEKRRGNRVQAIEYVTKEDTRVDGPFYWPDEATVFAAKESAPRPGQRVDLEAFSQAAADGSVDPEDRYGRFASIYARYPKFYIETLEHHRQRNLQLCSSPVTYSWSNELIERLSSSPCRRTINWYWSEAGNVGKSHFVASRVDLGAFSCNGGRFNDIYFSYSESGCPSEFIIDWPRHKPMEQFPYEVLESIKNGWFLSTKYGSRLVKFAVPHVIVFANSPPDMLALSNDRLLIKKIG